MFCPYNEAESLYKLDLRRHAQELKRMVPNFDDLPANAQIVMLDMIYNMGSNNFNPRKWNNFFNAIQNKDWSRAAKESHRKTPHEERNIWVSNMLRSIKE